MALPFANAVQAVTYEKVETYLKQATLFKDALRCYPDAPQFDILYGSTLVEIEVLPWKSTPGKVQNWRSCGPPVASPSAAALTPS
jgi:hypothetical protein